MCRVAQSDLKHRLSATSMVTFVTKRAALLRSQRSVRSLCGRRLWRGPSAAEVASLGWLPRASCLRCWIWTSQNAVPTNFAEFTFHALTWVNRARRRAEARGPGPPDRLVASSFRPPLFCSGLKRLTECVGHPRVLKTEDAVVRTVGRTGSGDDQPPRAWH
jgi:hypothetical protein